MKSNKLMIPSTATSRFHAFDAEDFDGWMHTAADNYAIGDGISEDFLGDYVALGDGPARQLGDDADLWRKLNGKKTISDIMDSGEAFPTSILFDGVRIRRRRGRLHLLAICRIMEPLTLMEAIAIHGELDALAQRDEEDSNTSETSGVNEDETKENMYQAARMESLLSDNAAKIALRLAVCIELDPQSEDPWKGVSVLSWFQGDPIHSIIGASKSEDEMRCYTDEERPFLNWHLHTADMIVPTVLMGLLLPSYFDFRAEDRLDYRSRGGLQIDAAGSIEAAGASIGKKRGGRVRVVSAINHRHHTSGVGQTSGSRAEPEAQVEVTGFWRRLSPTSIGRDKDGNPITGRTWVNSHIRWKEKPAPRRMILQKEPILPHLNQIMNGLK